MYLCVHIGMGLSESHQLERQDMLDVCGYGHVCIDEEIWWSDR